MTDKHTPTVLTVAGFDPYGGAGIQADIKTIHALGGYALSATTAITAQNSTGVSSVHIPPSEVLQSQLKTLAKDIEIDAIKIGMLGNSANVIIVYEFLKEFSDIPIVLDPIILSSSGTKLIEPDGLDILKEKIIPIVTIVTPNIPEAQTLSGILETDNLITIKKHLKAKSLLIKGGHSDDPNQSCDRLISQDNQMWEYCDKRIDTDHTHGTGCILSSAIATYLGQGCTIPDATKKAKKFLHESISTASFNLRYKDAIQKRSKNIV